MKNRPEPISHMLEWGMLSGSLLCILYLALTVGFSSPRHLLDPGFLIALLFSAYMIGNGLGMILGLIDGIILKFLMRGTPPEFTGEEINSRRNNIYLVLLVIPIIINLILIAPGYINSNFNPEFLPLNWTYFFYSAMPSMIAACASIYVANRYLFRLQDWHKAQDSRKSKIKNEVYHRLMDKADYDDEMHYQIENVEQKKLEL